jgi:hypothetical protein
MIRPLDSDVTVLLPLVESMSAAPSRQLIVRLKRDGILPSRATMSRWVHTKPGFLGRGQHPLRSRSRCRTRRLLVLEYQSEDSKKRNLRLCESETNGTAPKDGLCPSDGALPWIDASARRFIFCDSEIDSVDSAGKIIREKLHWKLLVLVNRQRCNTNLKRFVFGL